VSDVLDWEFLVEGLGNFHVIIKEIILAARAGVFSVAK